MILENKKKISPVAIVAIAAIAIVSFANFFDLFVGGVGLAGISIIIGVLAFFVVKIMEKQPFRGSGFDMKAIPENLKSVKNWLWMLSPVLVGVIMLPLDYLIPSAADFDRSRALAYLASDSTVIMIIELFVLALGEEIAMRAFFQHQLSRVMPVAPAIIITSVFFTAGHFLAGNIVDVSIQLLNVFVLSVLYGIIFHKTKNGWISGFAHFLSNLFVLIIYGVI